MARFLRTPLSIRIFTYTHLVKSFLRQYVNIRILEYVCILTLFLRAFTYKCFYV
jgi:hypothetical protein